MSLKDKFISLLDRFKAEEPAGEEPAGEDPGAPEPQAGPAPEPQVEPFSDPAVLELPPDHPFHQLYSFHQKQTGGFPAPRLCLDEDGDLPGNVLEREKDRLKTALAGICAARLRQVGGKGKHGKHGKKKEEKGEGGEPTVLDASFRFFISMEKLWAWVLIFPPVGGGAEATRESLRQAMAEQGISYGVDGDLADRIPREKNRYFHLFRIARGKPAFDGVNGNIVDYFARKVVRVLAVDEFDRVDYASLNLIRNVKQGEEICRLIKPTEGEPGRTVLDQEIPAKSGKAVPLPKGRNTEISEDGTLLLASISGDVEFTGSAFQVKPVLDIPENVDFSTGNINFLGDVNIRGDVRGGFSVRAMGNIQIAGAVEAGSAIEAGGDLVVVKGIMGNGSTVVHAQGSVFAKYIENSTVYVRENLQADCIVNSQIYSDGEVLVRSGRGAIIGGQVWAATRVSATAVGARSECRTCVALGGLPCTSFERDLVGRELEVLEAEAEKLEAQLDSSSRSSLLDKTRTKLTVAEMKLKQLENELAGIKLEAAEKESGRLECGIAYPGTEVSFGGETLRLHQENRQCVITMVHGEILVT